MGDGTDSAEADPQRHQCKSARELTGTLNQLGRGGTVGREHDVSQPRRSRRKSKCSVNRRYVSRRDGCAARFVDVRVTTASEGLPYLYFVDRRRLTGPSILWQDIMIQTIYGS